MTTRSSRHRRSAHRHSTCRPGGQAFTLVEMLIAMVLTLIMVYAIAEFYAYVGETVKDGRALIEIRGSMRTALQRLKDDLDHLTVKVTPPVDDGKAPGYLCLTEGLSSDADPEGNGLDVSPATDTIPDIGQDSNGNGIADYLEVADATNLLGDTDDVLTFTIRNDVDPFMAPRARPGPAFPTSGSPSTGIYLDTIMDSASIAEVAWWTSFTDNPTFATAGEWDLGEAKTLHRRLLLVKPELNIIHQGDTDYVIGGQPVGPYYIRVPGSNVAQAHYELLQFSDVSVRPLVVNNSYVVLGSPSYVYFTANSLADLTRRENRFMSFRHPLISPSPMYAFPNQLDLNPHYAGTPAAPAWDSNPGRTPIDTTFRNGGNEVNDRSLYRWMLNGARRGEDVVLSNILAFDMRVFDPTAVLRTDNTVLADGGVTLQPGDPGYAFALANGYAVVGAGAYVDLNYSNYTTGVSATASTFSGPSDSRSGLTIYPTVPAYLGDPSVYDTWAASYERDGLNQDGDALTDEGTNGLDDDGINGVDDSGERETLPPYPAPLRGIEIKVRVYEPGTRQAQQATVGADFVAE